jgi:hypothetical protein
MKTREPDLVFDCLELEFCLEMLGRSVSLGLEVGLETRRVAGQELLEQ